MKFNTWLALATAPLAMARKVYNAYPDNAARAVELEMDERSIAVASGMSGHGITVNSLTEIIIIWANPGGGAATTTYNNKVTVTQTVTVEGQTTTAAAAGATHTVAVGGAAGLVYSPPQLDNIPVGDTVIFEFQSMNHTVSQSAFDTPCKKLDGGMDSGFQPNPNNTISPAPQVAMQVMASTPLWFYCRQKGHCGKGMVFSINPTAAKTQAQFQQMAIAQNGTGAATPITGGSGSSAAPHPPAQTSAAAAAPPPPPAQSPAPAASGDNASGDNAGSVTAGKGTVGADGSCSCVVQCVPGSFPVNAAQGVGAHGGWGGSLPMKMAAMS
ncbi:Cupredoxin [Trichoderma ceciliae]